MQRKDDIEDSDDDPLFPTEKMPCRSGLARQALAEIIQKGEYTFCPLPALDTKFCPVPPIDYEKALCGSTVLMAMTLSAERYAKGLYYYADIQSIYILRSQNTKVKATASKSLSKRRRFEVPEVVKKARGL
jgi:hypothetical protein